MKPKLHSSRRMNLLKRNLRELSQGREKLPKEYTPLERNQKGFEVTRYSLERRIEAVLNGLVHSYQEI
jgi:hypothetical protein